ncbi:MAG: hypothetical protein ACXWQO_05165 [Bdellovibrionota bacterium]
MKALVMSLFCFVSLTSTAEAAGCTHPWIYFDTGETLVAVPPDYKNMSNEPGMEKYLGQLQDQGNPLGLVVNVPEDWGDEIPVTNLLARRVLYTQQFFREGWLAGAAEFPWGFFGKIEGTGKNRTFKGHVFFPTKNSDRKPAVCPTCALNLAFDEAHAAGCPAIYEGEDAKEMEAAEQIGFIPFQVGHTDSANFYLLPEKVQTYLKNYVPGRWKQGIRIQ